MGLDITAYSGLTKVKNLAEDDEDYYGNGKQTRFTDNRDFPDHFEGLEKNTIYGYDDSFSFRAGSYSSYSYWRGQLAELAGYGQDQLNPGETADPDFYAEAAWASKGGPFYELINFSDCEGTIGPKVVTKLLGDFEMFEAAAKNAGDDFYLSYKDWKRAFELASNNGAVSFH